MFPSSVSGFVLAPVTSSDEQVGSMTTGCCFSLLSRMSSVKILLAQHRYPGNKPAGVKLIQLPVCVCVCLVKHSLFDLVGLFCGN